MTDNSTLTLLSWQQQLKAAAQPEKVAILSSFFKCGKGEYGEGDRFLGITVPVNRAISRLYYLLPLDQIAAMLHSPYHEFRLGALLALVRRFERCKADRAQIVDFYLQNTRYINNWDLVDLTCRDIVGNYLLHRNRTPIYQLAQSTNLWEQRISIVSTWAFIHAGDFTDTFKLALHFQGHPHDLIHKAVGWMLREVGKQDQAALTEFLENHATHLPRTALRYAIERFPEAQRQYFLRKR